MERAEGERALVELEADLRRVLAPNPSPMTYNGTNSYLLGTGDVAVIDPGPALDAHHAAIKAALAPGERIAAILLTHSHLDHSPLAARLSAETGAPVLAAGPSDWGRSETMAMLARSGRLGGGEGVDEDFALDPRVIPTARRHAHKKVHTLVDSLGGQDVVFIQCQRRPNVTDVVGSDQRLLKLFLRTVEILLATRLLKQAQIMVGDVGYSGGSEFLRHERLPFHCEYSILLLHKFPGC